VGKEERYWGLLTPHQNEPFSRSRGRCFAS
jgi:hypothetical protein